MKPIISLVLTMSFVSALCAQESSAARESAADDIYFPAAETTQTEADEYTRYELLAPGTGRFKIYYEVTATTTGARFFYNPIRKGSSASDESVYDAMTGKPLHFEIVTGARARQDSLMPDADLDTHYIKVSLARPVPPHGQGRIIIVKTYEDRQSYSVDGKTLVFNRPLGIKRNKVVLPPGRSHCRQFHACRSRTGAIGITRDARRPHRTRVAPQSGDRATQLGIAVRRRNRRSETL
jgi:hypothetical protein